MFVGKATSAPVRGRLLALPTNVGVGKKGVPRTKTLAYWNHLKVMSVKSFYKIGPKSLNKTDIIEWMSKNRKKVSPGANATNLFYP